MDRVLTPGLGLLAPSSMIMAEQLAKAAMEIAKGRYPDTEIFPNKDLLEIAKLSVVGLE